ncbi:hypothetical protein [Streptomyces sp. RKAG293]|uniref:hypothetical protein n=1 Tax=Streptomyces sp. RKAG293 TaxID=2893403 RepID=UPI0027E3F779|nr:hypothetical protein [Streptomyces sp. RKAG293]
MNTRVSDGDFSTRPMRLPFSAGLPCRAGARSSAELKRRIRHARTASPPAPHDPIRRLRLRGSDGKRSGAGGWLGASIDPNGPIPYVPGDSNPWLGTWFHPNPISIEPKG